MNIETLNKGLSIAKEIDDLKNHLTSFNFGESGRYFNKISPLTANTIRRASHDTIILKAEFINMDEFVMIYKARVQARIDDLQKQFDLL